MSELKPTVIVTRRDAEFFAMDARITTLEAQLAESIARETATRQRAEAAELQAGEMRKALSCLRNEASASVEMARPCIGHTNAACLINRINQADVILTTPAPALHAELEAGRKDTARLEYVIKNGLTVSLSFDGWEWRAVKGDHIVGVGGTPREAIDAAMEPK